MELKNKHMKFNEGQGNVGKLGKRQNRGEVMEMWKSTNISGWFDMKLKS